MVYFWIQRVVALGLFIITLPLLWVLCVVVRLTSSGPFLFVQRRIGKDMNPFWIYKIRTMKDGSDALQSRYIDKNEADGPVFKIRKDPRYTRIGRFLSHSALDELPQLINIMKGEMAFVGPRPLPVSEARKVPAKYAARFSVLPGMTSSWIVKGAHALSFREWMELDCEYVRTQSVKTDIQILLGTIKVVLLAAVKG